MINYSIRALALAISCVTLVACGSKTTVTRIDTSEEIALTDKWNAKDSELVASAMIEDMLTFPWYNDFAATNADNPAVILQSIRNKSHEHISIDSFVNDIKRAMLRTGKLDFVAVGAERDDVREERQDQELNASADTANEMANELGADFALSGVINSFVDAAGDKRVTSFQIDLKLIDISNNREVWIGQKKIQKLQEKS
jgi:uncharacterized protein (TIGR02722 family)